MFVVVCERGIGCGTNHIHYLAGVSGVNMVVGSCSFSFSCLLFSVVVTVAVLLWMCFGGLFILLSKTERVRRNGG